jgi:phosphoserine aminotransferase
MTTFYPGPSQVYPQIAEYLQDAYRSGILSANHRSTQCMALVEHTLVLFHEKLNVPQEYSIFFTSSATECWEIISQSIISPRYVHIYNGAFGKKWYEYSVKLAQNECTCLEFGINETLPDFEKKYDDIVCITQNETSNGTQVNMSQLAHIQASNQLIAIDAVSSMAGIELDWNLADIWLASVQKCFGLPAGLGIMVCSPKTLHVVENQNQTKHYNSLVSIAKNMEKFQTTHTPNVLGIYLLNRVLQQIPNITETSKRIKKQAQDWYKFFNGNTNFEVLCKNETSQSDTVIVVKGDALKIEELKKKTQEIGLVLGKGYGSFAENTFRIANFPAIDPNDIEKLKHCISTF